jgi:hypothetical protein
MARAGGIQKAPEGVAPSKTENVKDAREIEAIKARIDSLQLTIQMKLDELHEKQAELKLMRQALNAKMHALGLVKPTLYPPKVALAAVAPSDAVQSSNKRPGSGMVMGALTMQPGPGVGTSAASSSSARPRGSQPRVPAMAALTMPIEPVDEEDSVLGEDALPEHISEEVRKELQRILPGLLRELLPKLLKEAANKDVGNPGINENSP